MSGILRLESLTKGNTLRQGDLTLLKYRLFDADGDKLDISGKTATVRLMKNNFTFIAYEKEGLTVAPDDTISFSVNKVLPSGLYHLEVIVDGQYIFPSRDDEGKLSVDKSSLGADVTIVEATGVEAVAGKATDMMKQDEEFIDGMIANVISDTNVGNIEEYYNQFNEAIVEFTDLKPKAVSAITKSDEALTKSQNALNVANGIDAKATNALSLSESADTLSKSVQEQFNQVVIDGDSSVESAQARVNTDGVAKATLKERLDDEHNEISAQLKSVADYIEIEPDTLRELESETDGDLLQKAFAMAEGSARRTISIKLGRIYEIDKPIMLANGIGYSSNPHLIIKGTGGGLRLAHNGFMFDGVSNSGGLRFQNVKFIGDSTYTHAMFNCNNLIQLVFDGCQFASTNTILLTDTTNGYLQSCRFSGCNFKGMRTYQIVGSMVYDMVLLNNIVEWGAGGLIKLTSVATHQYCSIGLLIQGNILEGISEQAPINLTHNGRCTIQGNYFEGNNRVDIDLTGGSIPHRGLSIKDNSFGNFSDVYGKNACIKVGKLYSNQGYDFSGNSGPMTVFDFTGSGGNNINMTGGIHTYGGALNYMGISSTAVYHNNSKPSAKVTLTPIDKTLEYPIVRLSRALLKDSLFVKLNYNKSGSNLYSAQYSGYLYFISGYSTATSRVELEVRFKPILTQVSHLFTEGENADGLNVVFKSTGTNRIPLSALDIHVVDTIVFESISGAISADSGYVVNMGSLIMN